MEKTPFKSLGISSPCFKSRKSKVRNGANVYYKEEYVGKIEEVNKNKIRLENGMIFIHQFKDGPNELLYIN